MIRAVAAYLLAPLVMPIVMFLSGAVVGRTMSPAARALERLLSAGHLWVVAVSNGLGCVCAIRVMDLICRLLQVEASLLLYALPVLIMLNITSHDVASDSRESGPFMGVGSLAGCITGIAIIGPLNVS